MSEATNSNTQFTFMKLKKGKKPPTEQEAEAFLLGEGYRAFRWHDVSGVKYPPHDHRHDECILILDGTIEFEIDGERIEMKPGDRLYLPAYTLHSAKVPEDKGVTYLVGEKY